MKPFSAIIPGFQKLKLGCSFSRRTALFLLILPFCVGCGQDEQRHVLSDRSTAGQEKKEDIPFERLQPENARKSLGEVLFAEKFERVLSSHKGVSRSHMVKRAYLIPRDEKGKANRSAAIEAFIDRASTEDKIIFSEVGELSLDTNGILEGQIRNGSEEQWNYGAYLELEAIVFDKELQMVPDESLVEPFELPASRLDEGPSSDKTPVSTQLFFHREWVFDREGLPNSETSRRTDAHYAAKKWFSILFLSKNRPYDPEKKPLLAFAAEQVQAAEQFPITLQVSVFGGIEPYEFRVSALPSGLKWNDDFRAIEGTPKNAGEYQVIIEIKDAQFPTGEWDQARKARKTLGNPYHQLSVLFDIQGPVEAELILPHFSRKGEHVSGICVVSGGVGRVSFQGVKMPPGVRIDAHTGKMSGRPTKKGNFEVEVHVIAAAADEKEREPVIALGEWKVIAPFPTPSLK